MHTLCAPPTSTPNSVSAFLDGVQSLPPTPAVLINLIELFRRNEVDVDEIVQLLRRDPALAAEVLRRCNSSFFGTDEQIVDVHEAVYRLGFYEVYQLTVMLFGMRALSAPKVVPGFPAAALRRHSSVAAIAAGALAREIGVPEGLAFTAGLLHDLGKLVFALAAGTRYVALLEDCQRTGDSLNQLETQMFGFHHGELGGALLRRWGMTEEIVLPVMGHARDAGNGSSSVLALLTQAASELANHLEQKTSGTFSTSPQGQHLLAALGLDAASLDGCEHVVRSKIKELDATQPL